MTKWNSEHISIQLIHEKIRFICHLIRTIFHNIVFLNAWRFFIVLLWFCVLQKWILLFESGNELQNKKCIEYDPKIEQKHVACNVILRFCWCEVLFGFAFRFVQIFFYTLIYMMRASYLAQYLCRACWWSTVRPEINVGISPGRDADSLAKLSHKYLQPSGISGMGSMIVNLA